MTVTKEFDGTARERVSDLYKDSQRLLELGSADPEERGVWLVQAGSTADTDAGISSSMPRYLAAEIDLDDERMETNLPLTQVRGLLQDAVGSLTAERGAPKTAAGE